MVIAEMVLVMGNYNGDQPAIVMEMAMFGDGKSNGRGKERCGNSNDVGHGNF